MAEPTTTTTTGGALLLATLAAAMGPLLAEWTIVIVGAALGSFLAATSTPTDSLRRAVLIFVRGLVMGAAFTSMVAALIAPHVDVAAEFVLLPVAALIGWGQERLIGLVRALATRKGVPDA